MVPRVTRPGAQRGSLRVRNEDAHWIPVPSAGMFTRLRTVRAKLTALVGLSIVVMLTALPILSWTLHREMLDEVDDRVVDARKSFLTELDDDLADITLASQILARDEGTRGALLKHDAAKARRMAETFLAIYPTVDVLLFDAGGLFAQVGCDAPPTELSKLGKDPLLTTGGFHGVLDHGCESSPAAPPAMVLSVALAETDGAKPAGIAVVCMPLDNDYVTNTTVKLGVSLALARGEKRFAKSPGFPNGGVDAAGGGAKTAEIDGKSWALATFAAPALSDDGAAIQVVDALDVTDVHRIIRRNLLLALLVLLLAGTLSVTVGYRLATVMSEALLRVNVALKKLGAHEYAYVNALKTGDELEDLAAGFNTMVDGLKERDDIKTTMGNYMTEAVMSQILAGKVELGGQTLTVTILFTDIRSFTTMSEKMSAQGVVELLNEYFTEMVEIVMNAGGAVDKFMGDAIMAVFGARRSRERTTSCARRDGRRAKCVKRSRR